MMVQYLYQSSVLPYGPFQGSLEVVILKVTAVRDFLLRLLCEVVESLAIDKDSWPLKLLGEDDGAKRSPVRDRSSCFRRTMTLSWVNSE